MPAKWMRPMEAGLVKLALWRSGLMLHDAAGRLQNTDCRRAHLEKFS